MKATIDMMPYLPAVQPKQVTRAKPFRSLLQTCLNVTDLTVTMLLGGCFLLLFTAMLKLLLS